MKKYKKYSGKLLQIRLADEEYEEIIEFIKLFKVTRREFILAAKTELLGNKIIRDGRFWESNQQYAWTVRSKHDKKITEDTVCEVCGEKSDYDLNRHHHYGYEGENAYRVNIVCKKCHGRMHADLYKSMKFEDAAVILRRFYKCKHEKYKVNPTNDWRKNEKICEDCGGSIGSLYLIKK